MRNLLACSVVAALALGTGAAEPARAQRDAGWEQTIGPLFARTCAECHMRDGEAGIDLASAAAWKRRRSDVRRSVVVDKIMPPSGRPFSDADREIVRAWIDGNAP